MNQQFRIDAEILSLFQNTLGCTNIEVDSAIGELDGWDSIGHVKLILALESLYKIKLTPSEIVKLTTVHAIRELVVSIKRSS